MGRDSTRGRLDRRTARSGPDRHGASARAKFRGVRKPIAARPGRLWHGASGGRAAGQVRWAPVSSAVLPLSLSARLTAPEGALRTTSAAARTRRPRACKPCQAFICAGPERALTAVYQEKTPCSAFSSWRHSSRRSRRRAAAFARPRGLDRRHVEAAVASRIHARRHCRAIHARRYCRAVQRQSRHPGHDQADAAALRPRPSQRRRRTASPRQGTSVEKQETTPS
mmetsp:Transcript_1555/g.4571  ORF Transcript_1555/g.4571 Transcript_1555/m.4571 type:complete len:225 (+) Transcript_1555:250-924(+)